jgi:prepilin-type N-terminal cleavage/methylation domain-containing protein
MSGVVEENSIGSQCHNCTVKRGRPRGFTLVELLVVLGIISVLMGILAPALAQLRQQAKSLMGMNNQRQTISGANFFAMDRDERYPESVATIGFGDNWNWQEPTMMTACYSRSPDIHRSMSAYLRSYIEDASIMFCPSAPRKYKYFQESWDAGDDWNNPETPQPEDPLTGTYCFYWNYVGFLGGQRGVFKGPWGPSCGRERSRLLVSDYFGYNHWRSRNAYGSCEPFDVATITEGTLVSSAYWSRPNLDDNIDPATLKIKLHAGYTDGHVESYSPSETVPMRISITSDGSVPYPDGIGPGVFYLPRDALH